jgi:hypothetical protein
MEWMKHLVLALTLLAISSVPAQDLEKKQREGIASARMTAMHILPAVTRTQCSVLLVDWGQRDKGDNADSPAWFMRLSTEELTRLFGQAFACEEVEERRDKTHTNFTRFALYALQFQAQLLFRAETVLRDHALCEEYLLQP